MGTIAEKIEVNAPLKPVWDAVIDFEARPKWEPRVKEAKVLDNGPLREGSRIRLRVDRDRFTATVVQIEPEKRLVLLVKGPGFRVHHSYALSSGGVGTVVSMTGEYHGLVGALVTRFMRGSLRRDLVDELTAIKHAAEGTHTG